MSVQLCGKPQKAMSYILGSSSPFCQRKRATLKHRRSLSSAVGGLPKILDLRFDDHEIECAFWF